MDSNVPGGVQPFSDPDDVPAAEGIVLRMLLGTQLRRLREVAGVTPERAGYEIRASRSKISRMETGQVGFKARDIADLLTLYGVSDEQVRARLLAMAQQSGRPDWWSQYGDILPGWFETYLGLESASSTIRTFELQFVHGLFQTEDYARAVTRLGHRSASPSETERRVGLRVKRQDLLTRASAPRIWSVMDEAVLRRPVGGAAVMRAQLDRLVEAAALPHVTLQVVPFARGGHAGASGSFTVLRFDEQYLPDVVYIEQLTGAVYLDQRPDVEHYLEVADQLSGEALTPAASRRFIERVAKETQAGPPSRPQSHGRNQGNEQQVTSTGGGNASSAAGNFGSGGNSGSGPLGERNGNGGSSEGRCLLARCPDVVPVGKPFSLLASVVRAGTGAKLVPFDVPVEGRDVLLVLHAPGLSILSDQRLTVHVPAVGDSSPVMFELRADREGPRSISITAWIGGSYLGELPVEIAAAHDRAGGEHREFLTEIDTEPSEGAVSLVVRYDQELSAYRFEFRDEDNPNEVVSRLSFEPRQRIERLVGELDRLATGCSGYSADQVRDYLVNAGAELWHELIPAGLREQFWERQHRIRQLTILADKDTVPWELLYPKDPGHDAGFLVQQFPVTRAIFGRRPASKLGLWPARFVLPQGSLRGAAVEIDAIRSLLDPSQARDAVISELTPLQNLIRSGRFGLLHFACHNRFEPDDSASIMLGHAQFTPRLMTTAVIDKVLERSAPTIFMNACRSAGLAPTYNRLDGWAVKFLEAGAGAFVGSLWAVPDETAREFAQLLYQHLQAGVPLGMAMMSARTAAAAHADDPTWLAYSAYGNPRATVRRL